MLKPTVIVSLVLLVLAVVVAFFPVFSGRFVNWDDDVHLLNNYDVQTLDWDHFSGIWSQTVNKIYIPLTSSSFALEWFFFGDNPFVYHFNNLVLHAGVVCLIFIFAGELGLSVLAAFLGALIFGIHPLHVESVAWITERKDVLYSFFYLLALTGYLKYTRRQRPGVFITGKPRYAFVVICSLLSMLSKPMALSLPLVMLLCDWYCKRAWSKEVFWEKVPVFVLAAALGWMTYVLHARFPRGEMLPAVLLWVWSLSFYVYKFVIPLNLYLFYSVPDPVSLSNPVYIASLLFFVLLCGAVFVFRKNRLWVFAVAFYFLSIFFVLRLDTYADANTVADRFMYLPSLGFCLLAGAVVARLFKGERPRAFKILSGGVAVLLLSLLMGLTYRQCLVWHDGESLWTYQLKHNSQKATALLYSKLGEALFETVNPHQALSADNMQTLKRILFLYDNALAIKPDYANVYYQSGRVHQRLGNILKAKDFYRQALEFDPGNYFAASELMDLFFQSGEEKKALGIYFSAIRHNLNNPYAQRVLNQHLRGYEESHE